jgi:hypothetical protein
VAERGSKSTVWPIHCLIFNRGNADKEANADKDPDTYFPNGFKPGIVCLQEAETWEKLNGFIETFDELYQQKYGSSRNFSISHTWPEKAIPTQPDKTAGVRKSKRDGSKPRYSKMKTTSVIFWDRSQWKRKCRDDFNMSRLPEKIDRLEERISFTFLEHSESKLLLFVMSAHGEKSEQVPVKTETLKTLLDWVRKEVIEKHNVPALIAGDFNLEPSHIKKYNILKVEEVRKDVFKACFQDHTGFKMILSFLFRAKTSI